MGRSVASPRSRAVLPPPSNAPKPACSKYKSPLLLPSRPFAMSDFPKVAIFWDYENCSPPSSSSGLGYDIVNNIARIARLFGSVSSFRAYLDISAQSNKSLPLRSELQSSGVSIIDCPHNGKKDVVDKMILVDMLAFAVDHPTPATIFLITGDRDYAYAVSILKLRKYQVILLVPSPHTSPSLESQASLVIDWSTAVMRTRTDPPNANPVRQPYFDLDPSLVAKLLRELQDDDIDLVAPSNPAARLRRVTARDLLESSRHSKNTESFDSTREFAHNPGSSKKCTDTGSDSAPTGLPIPKTPSRSRHASVSTGTTRARSTTIVAQSPPALEHCTPTKNPQFWTATRPGTSDLTNTTNPEKGSLPSLDELELPLHDDGPPSSIVIRSPLAPGPLAYDSSRVPGDSTTSSADKLDCSPSPFVMKKAPTMPQSVHSYMTVDPASPPLMRYNPQMKDIGALKDIGQRIENDEPDCEQSIVHSDGTCDVDFAQPTYPSFVASHTMHPLSDRNVDLHCTNSPLSRHASLSAGSLLGDSVDSAQSIPSPRASNIRAQSVLGSLSPSPSSGSRSQTLSTREDSETAQWTMFGPLIHLLLSARARGTTHPTRSIIAVELVKSDAQVYQRAGVSRFRDYTALAEQAGVIELGGREGDAWIALHPNWFGVDAITTTQFSSSNFSSSTPDLSNVNQQPSITDSEMIENAAIFQTPGPRPFETSHVCPTSPANRQESAFWSPRTIPAPFQPLIDTLVRLRAEGTHEPRRSLVGQMFDPVVYSQAGVSGFREYIQQALEMQLIEFGGVGGFAWIRIHADLRI